MGMYWREIQALLLENNKRAQSLAVMGHARPNSPVERPVRLHHTEKRGDLMAEQHSGNAKTSPFLWKKEAIPWMFRIRYR